MEASRESKEREIERKRVSEMGVEDKRKDWRERLLGKIHKKCERANKVGRLINAGE